MTIHTEPTMVERQNFDRKRVVGREDAVEGCPTPSADHETLYGAYFGSGAILSEGE